MPEQPKVQMNFHASVYGAAGNVEGDQNINVPDQDFEALLAEYKQFIQDIQQKHPHPTSEAQLQQQFDQEVQAIAKTQPQRWQNFLSLKRLWQGGKKPVSKWVNISPKTVCGEKRLWLF